MTGESGGRGQGLVAFVFAAAVVTGGLALDHGLGERAPAPAQSSAMDSGAWLCPHGGGSGWQGRLYLANPGTDPSTVRVTALTAKSDSVVRTVAVDPGTTVEVDVPATEAEASTYVEYFGAWVAAGWLTVSPDGNGVGAERCAAATDATTWYTANGGTPKGATSNLVIMNPYGVNAIFDVVLFATDRAPVHQGNLTDVVLKPHRSMIVPLAQILPLEAAVGSEIDVHAGRLGVAALDTSVAHGVGAVLGTTRLETSVTIPLLAGAGQRSLSLVVPGPDGIRFDGSSLDETSAQPTAGLSNVAQEAQTSQSYSVVTSGATGLRLTEEQGSTGGFVASVVSLGEGTDPAETGGAPPAARLVVLPTVAGDPSKPGLVITDPGTAAVTVTLHALSASGPNDVTLDVAAGSSASAPIPFLSAAEDAGILITSTGGPVIAAGASESLGQMGIAAYAMAAGIAVPGPA
ncbi:MAG: hypothetical protein QOE25_50 [Actinomycetota bacterium]|nr:hypothetical protein [Actinomycetota bacterium]